MSILLKRGVFLLSLSLAQEKLIPAKESLFSDGYVEEKFFVLFPLYRAFLLVPLTMRLFKEKLVHFGVSLVARNERIV